MRTGPAAAAWLAVRTSIFAIHFQWSDRGSCRSKTGIPELEQLPLKEFVILHRTLSL